MNAKTKPSPKSKAATTPTFFKDRFKGKAVIVTGAASGLGKETALRLAREGAALVLVDLKQDALDEVAAETSKAAPKAETKPEPAKETPVSPAAPAEKKAPTKKTSVRKATATRKRR